MIVFVRIWIVHTPISIFILGFVRAVAKVRATAQENADRERHKYEPKENGKESWGLVRAACKHKEADDEVKELKDRYSKVKLISDEWMKKAETLIKEWKLLDNTVNELNSWVATDRGEASEQNFSLEKMESTLGELKNIFKEKERLVDNL